MTSMRMILHDKLKFGHDHNPPLNARIVGREQNIESLAASIKTHGLGQALTHFEDDQGIFIVDGNRRLAAIRKLVDEGVLPKDYAVRCDPGDGVADADELSLALNFEREPMHEADTYQKFHELSKRELSAEDIAMRFGVEPKRVRKFLALGRLHSAILQAWRNDKLCDRWGQGTAEILHAFTIAPTTKDQGKVFHKLVKEENLSAWEIRSAFGAIDSEVARALKVVGIEEYKSAGGTFTEDLFGENHVIDDPKLMMDLAEKVVQSKFSELEDEGWSWVSHEADLANGWNWSWDTIEPQLVLPTKKQKMLQKLESSREKDGDDETGTKFEKIRALQSEAERMWPDADKQKSGCVVSRSHDGSIEVKKGVLKPGSKKSKPKAENKDGKKPTGLSDALLFRLSEQLTQGVRSQIVNEPHTALAALLAGLSVNEHASPFKAKFNGFGSSSEQFDEDFNQAFERFLGMTDDVLLQVLAKASREAISMIGPNSQMRDENISLTHAMSGPDLNKELLEAFDAQDYFKSAPIAMVLEAVSEALTKDDVERAAKLKKKDLAAFAIENVVPTGWLPHPLRTAHYDGPSAAGDSK